jgi:hypothetical protein
MDQKQLNKSLEDFIQIKDSIEAEESEKRRIELYEEMQILKSDILNTCSKNNVINTMIKLIQLGIL